MSADHVPPLPPRFSGLSDEELLAALDVLADDVQGAKARYDQLLADRLAVFGELADRGITQKRISEHAKVTPMAVAFVLRPPERRRSKPKAATKKRVRKSA